MNFDISYKEGFFLLQGHSEAIRHLFYMLRAGLDDIFFGLAGAMLEYMFVQITYLQRDSSYGPVA